MVRLARRQQPERSRTKNEDNNNYPNEAFRLHNEMKMLAKLKHKVDPEVQDLLPEAVELAKQKKEADLQLCDDEEDNFKVKITLEDY